MMELIKSSNSQYEEYESLLLERDQVHKEAGQIWTSYIRTFGRLICDVYEEKLECIKRKKSIAYYQRALNHDGVVDPSEMQKFLDQEMAQYQQNLKQMLDDHERCRNAKSSTSYEVERSKTLFRRLAKLLHPDINPQTDRQRTLMELWNHIQIAYGKNDVKELSELEVLVRKALKETGAGEVRVEIPDIAEKIASLKKKIKNVMETEPYTHRFLLEDEEKERQKKSELMKELEAYQKYRKELDAIIENMMGGIKILWKTSL